jgi:hypothetical protein
MPKPTAPARNAQTARRCHFLCREKAGRRRRTGNPGAPHCHALFAQRDHAIGFVAHVGQDASSVANRASIGQPDPVHEVALPWTLSGFRHSFIFYVGLNSPSMAALNGEKWDFTTVPTSCVERLLPSQADRARRLLVVVEPLNLSGSHPSAIQVGALRRFRRRTSSIQPPTPSCVM